MRRKGLRFIPQSLAEALDEFEARRGRPVGARARARSASSCDVKRREWVRYHSTVSRWETDQYLTLF